jgi:hypothetical protein
MELSTRNFFEWKNILNFKTIQQVSTRSYLWNCPRETSFFGPMDHLAREYLDGSSFLCASHSYLFFTQSGGVLLSFLAWFPLVLICSRILSSFSHCLQFPVFAVRRRLLRCVDFCFGRLMLICYGFFKIKHSKAVHTRGKFVFFVHHWWFSLLSPTFRSSGQLAMRQLHQLISLANQTLSSVITFLLLIFCI